MIDNNDKCAKCGSTNITEDDYILGETPICKDCQTRQLKQAGIVLVIGVLITSLIIMFK
jgi:RNA polymerase subunit RPABC4/transcription elongation factor Spt4